MKKQLANIILSVFVLVILGACATGILQRQEAEAPGTADLGAADTEARASTGSGASVAEAPPVPQDRVGADEALRPVFAWELERGDARVLLFGSIHVGSPDLYPLPPAYDNAVESADQLVVEVAVDQIEQAAYTQLIGRLAYLDGGKTLQDLVDAEDWATIAQAMQRYQIPVENVLPLRPFFLDTTLATLAAAEAGFESQFGMDLWFLRRARGRSIPIMELETAAEQLGYLADLPESVQAGSLVITAQAAVDGQAARDVARLVKAVTTGDTEALLEILGKGSDEHPELQEIYERLFVDRNYRWADQIDAHTEIATTSLVVVGAGHLVGDENLREILRRRGYSESRISPEAEF